MPLTAPLVYQTLPAPYQTIQRVTGLCYAEGTHWDEQHGSGNVTLYQQFEYYRPLRVANDQAMPLVIWSHPNGSTESMFKVDLPGGHATRMDKQVLPALDNGFAFMSIEFRHPRASQPAPPTPPVLDIPNTDIAHAVQWARQHASDLAISAPDVYLLGQSRGTLALLTAFMPDQQGLGTGDYAGQSSKPLGVFAVQAQTTFEHVELRDIFVRPASSVKFAYPSNTTKKKYFDYHQYLDQIDPPFITPGSALTQWDATDPPAWLRYERTPTNLKAKQPKLLGVLVADPGQDPNLTGVCHEPVDPLYPWNPGSGCFDVHHPNFGQALLLRSGKQGVGAQFGPPIQTTDPNVGLAWLQKISDQFYDRYVCFFIQHMTPAGQALRLSVMGSNGYTDCKITDQAWPQL